jgi:ABC-type glycerol-3-phosphate transport system substrate-binding protein
MRTPRLRPLAAVLVAAALAGCGSETVAGPAAPAAPASTTTVAVTTAPAAVTPAPSTTVTTIISLGPEWLQRDGRVRIEATASGDPQALLRDLQALGLTDGVVFGRIVNGWLPVGAFAAMQRLGSLQLVRPTGAGTG